MRQNPSGRISDAPSAQDLNSFVDFDVELSSMLSVLSSFLGTLLESHCRSERDADGSSFKSSKMENI